MKKKEDTRTPEEIQQYNLDIPKRAGLYYSDGVTVFPKPLPAVTDVLNVLDKSGLGYWSMKKCVEIALAEPWLRDKEVIDKHFNDNVRSKGSIGTKVHDVAKDYFSTGNFIVGENDDTLPYLIAFTRFLEENEIEPLYVEKILHCADFAGRCDLICQLNGKSTILDIKTGKSVYPETGLQLQAYAYMTEYKELVKDGIKELVVLHLKDNGRYALIEMDENLDVFWSCLKIFEWRKKED